VNPADPEISPNVTEIVRAAAAKALPEIASRFN